MTSIARRDANRRNAQRSTGPRTPAGKATSSKNALQHGLLAAQTLLPDEDADALTALSTGLIDQLAPSGPLEELLVTRITSCAWRLQRVWRLEAGVITFRTIEARAVLTEAHAERDPLAAGLIRDATGADALSKLSRYECSLERGLYRALHELQRLQAARSGRDVAPPVAIDVSVSPPAD